MVPFPGALTACCLARAGGVPAACAPAVPGSGSWLSSPVRLSLLFSPARLSPLYFSSSLPPSLSPYLLPPSLCSLSLPLSLLLPPSRLPGWLASSRAPPLAPAAAAPVAPPGLPLPWSGPTMTRQAPSCKDDPAGPGPCSGHPAARLALPRAPCPPSRSSGRAIVPCRTRPAS